MKPLKLIAVATCFFILTDSCSQPLRDQATTSVTFVATTPCSKEAKPLPGMLTDIDCEFMKWKLTLYYDSNTNTPTTYQLDGWYGMTVPNTNSVKDGGTKLERRGKWVIGKGMATDSIAIVYQLDPDKPDETVYFQKLDDNVIHLLNRDKHLVNGNSGWSFTLNREERLPAATTAVNTTANNSRSLPITGDTSSSQVFDGRTPCLEIAEQLKVPVSPGCRKLKWRLILYHDPQTLQPTTYKLLGTLYRQKDKEGKWIIVKGMATNPNAIVYQLDPGKPGESVYLLKGDDNVLFILDENKRHRVGDKDFSYTLNRIRK